MITEINSHPLSLDPDTRADTLEARYAAANRSREVRAEAKAIAALATGDDGSDD